MFVQQEDYKVRLEVFEGPLDLLLYLIKKDEVDIYDIPMELVTRQYMEYIGLMEMLDLNIAGDFLVMAATLLMIKSRMLLPVEERPVLDDEEEDPRWDLVRKLLEYKKFKEAAAYLQDREYEQENIFPRGAEDAAVEPVKGVGLDDVSLFDLLAAFNEALKRVKTGEVLEIFAEKCTVADKIADILQRIRASDRISFFSIFSEASSRTEVVCAFLALLELIRLRQIRAIQDGIFHEIFICRSGVEAARLKEC
ncbi:MAG: segregation/condensation protein A [Lentisphaerae bacterium]|nr:segregation/condensation protein A [Lentisphaerota bacterium]